MTAKECYEKIGGNYDEAIGRLMMDDMVTRFVKMFLNDTSFAELEKAMSIEDYDAAFKAAHTLKGVCQNLSLAGLSKPADEITENLREATRNIDRAKVLFEEVKKQYEINVTGIREL